MVRTIAMDGTEGLVCGQRVLNTGSSISVPVGRASLDHIMNVIAEPVDEKGGISSGYEREDSSGNEVEGDSSGLLADAEAVLSETVDGNPQDSQPNAKGSSKIRSGEISVDLADPLQADFANYILKHKSVYKCRLCPRIVCLNEPSITAHLESKRHARSKKLLTDGRLKLMLNSDGEIEEEQETHSERHARTLALAEKLNASKKRDAGRQRQSWRRKKRSRKSSDVGGHTEKPIKKSGNKRPQIED